MKDMEFSKGEIDVIMQTLQNVSQHTMSYLAADKITKIMRMINADFEEYQKIRNKIITEIGEKDGDNMHVPESKFAEFFELLTPIAEQKVKIVGMPLLTDEDKESIKELPSLAETTPLIINPKIIMVLDLISEKESKDDKVVDMVPKDKTAAKNSK